jgi:hypothetical protein
MCVYRCPYADCCAEQQEGGGWTPPLWILPGSGRAPTVRVSWPGSRQLCRAARGRELGPSPLGLARLGPRTAGVCVAALTLSAMPSSEREGAGPLPAGSYPALAAHCLCVCRGQDAIGCAKQQEAGAGPLLAGPRPARAAHLLCVCCGPVAVSCAEQQEGGGRPPSRRVSPGTGSTPPVRVKWPRRCTAAGLLSSNREGSGPLPAGSRPTRAAHSWCVCRGLNAVGYAKQREGGSRAPPCRVLPGPGRETPLRVLRPRCYWLCQAARGREQDPFLPGLALYGPRTACACVAAPSLSAVLISKRDGAGSLPTGPRPVRAAHRLCVCRGPIAVSCADQQQPGLARPGPRTTGACVAALTLLAAPSSEREGAGPLLAGPRPVRAAHSLCVCCCPVAVSCAEQQ